MNWSLAIRVTPLGALLLVLAGCAGGGDSRRVDNFLGEKAVRVLKAADRIEVYHVAGGLHAPVTAPAAGSEEVGGYPVVSTGRPQDAPYARRLAAALREDGNYEWEIANGCMFDPGVVFRVRAGVEHVLVLVCFHCDDVGLMPDDDETGGAPHKGDHKPLRIHDINAAGRAALLALAKEALSDDAEIQKLGATRGGG